MLHTWLLKVPSWRIFCYNFAFSFRCTLCDYTSSHHHTYHIVTIHDQISPRHEKQTVKTNVNNKHPTVALNFSNEPSKHAVAGPQYFSAKSRKNSITKRHREYSNWYDVRLKCDRTRVWRMYSLQTRKMSTVQCTPDLQSPSVEWHGCKFTYLLRIFTNTKDTCNTDAYYCALCIHGDISRKGGKCYSADSDKCELT